MMKQGSMLLLWQMSLNRTSVRKRKYSLFLRPKKTRRPAFSAATRPRLISNASTTNQSIFWTVFDSIRKFWLLAMLPFAYFTTLELDSQILHTLARVLWLACSANPYLVEGQFNFHPRQVASPTWTSGAGVSFIDKIHGIMALLKILH